MPLSQTGNLLKAEDIIARASDCVAVPCPRCHGRRFIEDYLCHKCGGDGQVLVIQHRRTVRVDVLLPALLLAVDVGLLAVLIYSMFH